MAHSWRLYRARHCKDAARAACRLRGASRAATRRRATRRCRTSRPCAGRPSPRCGARSSGRSGAPRPPAMRGVELVVACAAAEERAQVVAADGEEAGVELPVGGEPRAGAVAAERLRDRGDDADLARAVAVAVALGDLAAVRGLDRLERELGVDRAATISAAGTTSSRRQPFVAPTSMYSMKRTMWPVPRKRRAMSRTEPSFTPRFTTTLTLTGSPAAAAASIPSSTRATGKSTSFIARKTSSSSESRLTVTRVRPASASAFAFAASSAPFVVSVRSRSPSAASSATRSSRSRRTSGSPPVIRSFVHAEVDEDARDPLDLLEGEQLAPRRGSGSRARRPPSACSRRSGSCSGR